MPTARVISPGPLATVQDLGRRGVMSIGVPTGGALDVRSHALANRLVGNPETAATIEATAGGLHIEFSTSVMVAVTGADLDVWVGARGEATNCRLLVPAHTPLRLGSVRAGLRSYVAIAGGIVTKRHFGSRSTDMLSGLAPYPLHVGQELPLGAADLRDLPTTDSAPVATPSTSVQCRVFPGPRRDWLDESAWAELTTSAYSVTADSNRIGVRLDGPPLRRARDGELHSEGIVTGAIQVPGDGRPVVFMHDHPTTGGYPVIGIVHSADLPLLAQLAPGARVRFSPAEQAGTYTAW